MKTIPLAAAALLVSTSACQTSTGTAAGRTAPRLAPAPADVYRAHAGQPIPAGTVLLAPADLGRQGDPESAAFVAAVTEQLARHGFAATTDITSAQYLGSVRLVRGTASELDRQFPTELRGLSATGAAQGTGLVVQLRRSGDQALVWQGRASTYLPPRGDMASLAPLLARALLEDFPGPSGRTIRR